MPDDEKITEQNEEVKDEAEESFDSDTDEMPDKDKAASDESKPDAGGDEKKPDDDKKAETAKDRIDQRLEAMDEETPDAADKQADETVKQTDSDRAAKVQEAILLIPDDALPEDIQVAGRMVSIKAYSEEFPEEFATMKYVAAEIARKIIGDAMSAESKTVKGDIDKIQLNVRQIAFDNQIAQAKDDSGNLLHPDYYQIVYGSGKEDFVGWVTEQPKKIQKLAQSLDPKDGFLVLDYYKEATAKKKMADHDKKSYDKKNDYDDIHSSASKGGKTTNRKPSGTKYNSDYEEAEAAFMEDD